MKNYRLAHLSDEVLLRALAALVAEDRETNAALLAHIAEADARRLESISLLTAKEEAPEPVVENRQLAPAPVAAITGPVKLTLIAPERDDIEFIIPKSTYDKLLYAQALLSEQMPSVDLEKAIEFALEAWIRRRR